MKIRQQRILIVDDDADLREAIHFWLAKANVDVVVASNGDEAFEILSKSEPVDLVLTDFMMPERNGIELVRLLKADTRLFDIPLVMMSNNADPEHRKRAVEMGACAYVMKSEGARALAERAIQMITSRKPEASADPPQASRTAQVQAMQQSLLELIRVTSQIEGMPVAARSALMTAEKLAEILFAPVPESDIQAVRRG